MTRRAILAAVAATVTVLQAPTPLWAVDDIDFSVTASDSGGVIQCLGPLRESGCRTFKGSGTTTLFYQADINTFSPFGPWRCEVLTGPVALFGCPDRDGGKVWFCLVPPKASDPPRPSVDLRYTNGVLNVLNQPTREENKPCPARATSFLGQNGEDAAAATPRRSTGSAADGEDVDTFDLKAEAGGTVKVTLDADGSAGSIGKVATLRLLTGAGRTVLAEKTGPLPLTLQVTPRGPASIEVQRVKRGKGIPFRGYYTLDVSSAFLLVPREDVEQ
jgi:hypothetical protein